MKHLVLLLALVCACKKKSTDKPADPTPGSAAAGSAAPAAPADAAPAAWDGKAPHSVTEGLATPESVLYDAEADLYLVSNINGKPVDTDDNGFIMRVAPDGTVRDAKWIDGTKDNVQLDAPKGMAIAGGVLYVADITVVRRFDAKTGEPRGEVKIAGASFLNDITPAPDGGVYVTDSGLDASFAPTGTDAVHHVAADGKVKPVIADKALGGPNGIVVGDGGSVWVVTFGSGEIFGADAKGKKQAAQRLPKGQLDGVVKLDGGDLLVSSWEGSAIYRGKPGGEWKPVVENVKSPADIGFDARRKRILIPVFLGDAVILHPYEP